MRHRHLSLLVLATVLTGCFDDGDQGSPMTAPVPPADGSVAYLTVSDVRPDIGDTIIVTGIVKHGAAVSEVGAFTAHLAFEAGGLEFLGDREIGSGMRALNARTPGRVIVAGASGDGFAGGTLFALAFRVTQPTAIETMRLELPELGGRDFSNHLPKLAVDRRVFASQAR